MILWQSGLELPMGQFQQILKELPARDMPIFLFLDNNLSKCQGILTRLGTCIDITEILFGIANGKFHQFLTELSACSTIMAGYYRFTFLFSFLDILSSKCVRVL